MKALWRQEWRFTGNILVATFSHLVALWPAAAVNFALYRAGIHFKKYTLDQNVKKKKIRFRCFLKTYM